MPELERLLTEVRAVLDNDAARALCLDCWIWATVHGEPAGLAWARMLLDGVTRYVEHERRTREPLFKRHD